MLAVEFIVFFLNSEYWMPFTSLNSATCWVLNMENTLLPDRFTAFLELLLLARVDADLEMGAGTASGSAAGASSSAFSSFFTFFFLTFSFVSAYTLI